MINLDNKSTPNSIDTDADESANQPNGGNATLSDDVTLELLYEGASELGLTLSAKQIGQFTSYYRELATWNERMNLTAITDCKDVQVKHFLDSLVGLPILAEELNAPLPLEQALHAVDVGTGAGLPGIPLKIACPQLKLSLMDGTGKKIQFMTHVIESLDLENVELVQGRAEELGRQEAHRGQYDLVTARAVAPLNTLVEYLLPLTRRNGMVMIYKGANVAEEFMAARKAIETLGGDAVRLAPVNVPYLDQKRFILLIKKVAPTPIRYPRGQGLARKSPL